MKFRNRYSFFKKSMVFENRKIEKISNIAHLFFLPFSFCDFLGNPWFGFDLFPGIIELIYNLVNSVTTTFVCSCPASE